jgi:uncharacterized oligopeptide transporter (OPT) family protein
MKLVEVLAIAVNINTPVQLGALIVLGGLAVWFGRGR